MNQQLAHITLLVNDYEESIEFFTEKLNFTLVEDKLLNDTKRWVIMDVI